MYGLHTRMRYFSNKLNFNPAIIRFSLHGACVCGMIEQETGGIRVKRRLLIHDLDEAAMGAAPQGTLNDWAVFPARPMVTPCVGCFGCWVKTPGECVIRDRASPLLALLASCDELFLVSRCVYGGLSPEVKAAMDRSIGYMLPFFRIVNDEMHHTMRYPVALRLRVFLYGNDLLAEERAAAEELVKANALNLGAEASSVRFFASPEAVWEVLA